MSLKNLSGRLNKLAPSRPLRRVVRLGVLRNGETMQDALQRWHNAHLGDHIDLADPNVLVLYRTLHSPTVRS
jgi:hypothetical protein